MQAAAQAPSWQKLPGCLRPQISLAAAWAAPWHQQQPQLGLFLGPYQQQQQQQSLETTLHNPHPVKWQMWTLPTPHLMTWQMWTLPRHHPRHHHQHQCLGPTPPT
jgi:hypothetical protein